jgi:hypothetical protein
MNQIERTNQPFQGIIPTPAGILYGQNARVDELNDRILSRFSCDAPLQANFDVRPVPTKYSRFPIIDRVAQPKISIKDRGDFRVSDNFAPVQSNGPVDGYFSQVDKESTLRNQFFAIQAAPKCTYIPKSDSDLYKVKMPTPSIKEPQPHPSLFERYRMDVLAPVRNADPTIGHKTFMNDTRVQLRGGVLNPNV